MVAAPDLVSNNRCVRTRLQIFSARTKTSCIDSKAGDRKVHTNISIVNQDKNIKSTQGLPPQMLPKPTNHIKQH